jgi:hypothetical protein
MQTIVAPPAPQYRTQYALIGEPVMTTTAPEPEVIEYRSTGVRCPGCRQWRRSLLILEDGHLTCRGCLERPVERRDSRRKAAIPVAPGAQR